MEQNYIQICPQILQIIHDIYSVSKEIKKTGEKRKEKDSAFDLRRKLPKSKKESAIEVVLDHFLSHPRSANLLSHYYLFFFT